MKFALKSLLIGLFTLGALPFNYVVIFFSGDSCCGEDTSATMRVVTLVIVVLHIPLMAFLHWLFGKKLHDKDNHGFWLGVGISMIVPIMTNWILVETIVRKAFGAS